MTRIVITMSSGERIACETEMTFSEFISDMASDDGSFYKIGDIIINVTQIATIFCDDKPEKAKKSKVSEKLVS